MKSINYFFVRHGETEGNQDNLLQGWTDSPLSTNGRQQLLYLSKKFSKIPIHLAYSSDLNRGIESINILLSTQKKPIDVKISEKFREFNYGSFEGQPEIAVWPETFSAEVQRLRDEKIPDNEFVPIILDNISKRDPRGSSENFITFWNRIEEGMLEVHDNALEIRMELQQDSVNVIIMTHLSPIRYFLHEVLPEFILDSPLDYGAYAQVIYQNGEYRLEEWNENGTI